MQIDDAWQNQQPMHQIAVIATMGNQPARNVRSARSHRTAVPFRQ
jgi:hypothetical protein